MAFVAIELKRNEVLLAMDVQLKNAQLLLKLVKSSVTLKLMPYFLANVNKGQAVATFVERKSRLTIVKRLHGRDS